MGVGKLAPRFALDVANLPTPMPSLLAQQRKKQKSRKGEPCGFWAKQKTINAC
jgi:hypothetical protein